MTKKDLKSLLEEKPGYLKWGAHKLANKYKVNIKDVREIIRDLRYNQPSSEEKTEGFGLHINTSEYLEFLKWKKSIPAISEVKRKLPKPYKGGNPDNVLVVGDLHEPFCLKGYLEFCREQQEIHNCGTVIFIGDVIDNHYSSYHETDTVADGADTELDKAVAKISEWYQVFPKAHVLIGNHDRMAYRKARTSGISSKWVRGYSEVLGTPGWKFVEEIIINGVNYNHGEGGTARKKMKDEGMSQVQGHLHSQAYIEYSVGTNFIMFGMQVGCGVDRQSHAMAYGKNFKKPVMSCGVVLNKGKQPILIPMEL